MPLSTATSLKQPLQRAFGRRAVVAEDVVDQRVVEDLQLFERIDQTADVVIGVFEEAGIDFHLARAGSA